MFLVYDIVFFIYALIYLPYLLLTRRGYAGYRMRFGLFSPQLEGQIESKDNIWLHAVSVGEVMVIDRFVDRLRKDHPTYQLIVTVTTKTGYELALERLKGRAMVLPSPLDFSFVAASFVSLIKPKVYIVVETEIWPNLYSQLHHQGIPLIVINGRISDTSFGRYKAIRSLLKGILNQVNIWCMQSQTDAQRIMELGAESQRVIVTGNIKFDENSKFLDQSQVVLPALDGRLWWVAGSTHPGEEEIVLDVYSKVIKDDPKWRLVIAPRHIDRVPQIMELITGRGLKAVKLSDILTVAGGEYNDAIIVVDSIGQLRSLYSLASLVFVGKSLCVGGGHNIIEPAFFGKAIIIGSKVENFRDIVACFNEGHGVVQVEDASSFESAVKELCADAAKREVLGNAAKKVIAANQGAAGRCLERLSEFVR